MREKNIEIENSERSRELVGNNQGYEPLVNCKGHQSGKSGQTKCVSNLVLISDYTYIHFVISCESHSYFWLNVNVYTWLRY